jgi:pimeloyl-ACP methyl ester carboxylesterase
MTRILKRALITVLLIVLAAASAVLVLWHLEERRLERESEEVDTEAGPVEVASVGVGPAVLLLHGSPGGYDQLLPLARVLARHGYRGLALSRPGYLQTPLDVGRGPRAQADAMAALLDALEVDDAAVLGVSGGGPAALQLALRHPARVRALVLVAAVAVRERPIRAEEIRHFGPAWNLGALAASEIPWLGFRLLGAEGELLAALRRDHEAREALHYLFGSLIVDDRRSSGYRNDVLAFSGDELDDPLTSIRAPTLVLRGSEDTSVPAVHAERVLREVQGAELRTLEGAGHALFVSHHHWLEEQILEFLAELGARR